MNQMFRKTKVIATIGPACDDIPTLKAMIEAGFRVRAFGTRQRTLEDVFIARTGHQLWGSVQ